MITEVLRTLPLSNGVIALWFIVGFILLVTTMDSAAYTMGAACTKRLGHLGRSACENSYHVGHRPFCLPSLPVVERF